MRDSKFKDPFATANTAIHLHLSDKSNSDISNITGIPIKEVDAWVTAFNDSRRNLVLRSTLVDLTKYDRVIKLYTTDKSTTEICKTTGIAYQTILRYVENYNQYISDGKPKKRAYYNCEIEKKLSVDEYIDFVNNGFSDSDIATYVEMSRGSIIKFKIRHEAEIKRRLNNTSNTTPQKEVAVTVVKEPERETLPQVVVSDTKLSAIEFTAMGDSALNVVTLLMKMKDTSSVFMKDISDLSNLLKDADISTYTLEKIS